MEELKVSIVTPSYNQANYLERTIISVLEQDYSNIEYIIIDGASTDNSVNIIKKYENQLAYWVSEKDKGQADAINKGFGKATGDIYAWLNSDDTYELGAISKVVNTFREFRNADLVFGDIWLIDEFDRKLNELKFPDYSFETMIYVGGSLHQTAAFWRRSLFERVGGLNPNYRFCMDFDFFCRSGEIGNFIHIPTRLANFRMHNESKSSKLLDIAAIEHKEIRQRYIPEDRPEFLEKIINVKHEVRRAKSFIKQGDLFYLLRGFRRFKLFRSQDIKS